MVRTTKPARKPRTPRPVVTLPADDTPPPILERPDGYYWQAPDGRREFGPFASPELAQADRDAVGDEALAPGGTLQEIEHEIGIAHWIDAETGEPAEGGSPPHLQEE